METDFDKVIKHFKDALTELEKGEHDQLASFYKEGYHCKYEILNKLIKDTSCLKIRWEMEGDVPEYGPDVEMCECGYHPKDISKVK